MEEYIARFHKKTKETQLLRDHSQNVSKLCKYFCDIDDFSAVAELTGLFHDVGKIGVAFQTYIRNQMEQEQHKQRRGEVNHATSGGVVIPKYVQTKWVEIMIIAIFSHHGLYDCIKQGQSIVKKRCNDDYLKDNDIHPQEDMHKFLDEINMDLCTLYKTAKKQLDLSYQKVMQLVLQSKDVGSKDFYMGMYMRLLLSILVDSDRSDARAFDQHENINLIDTTQHTWDACIQHFNAYMKTFKDKKSHSPMDIYREEIANACFEAANTSNHLYRLNVPTGAGKTLSSLRFALHHAHKYHKRHIIYVAPYKSILDQNAEEIRNAIGNDDFVLEHHSDIIYENEIHQERYERLVENWDSPIIVTTSVQFLNALFTSRHKDIRRMHALCNSVIILDEVQALPIRTMKLLNGAINYVSGIGKSTIVLCSATQPRMTELNTYCLLKSKQMVSNYLHYEQQLKRTTIINKIENASIGWSIDELCDFIQNEFISTKQLLVVVNTKSCAKKVFDKLKDVLDEETLVHLSTNMYTKHRKAVIHKTAKRLRNHEPIICISTQLIEAGVDLSFQGVIRSLAGLDNIIQTAGRCNRHMQKANGNVYIVKMSKEAENIDRIKDIKLAQDAMMEIINMYAEKPCQLDDDLSSEKAQIQYYRRYQSLQKNEMDYYVDVDGLRISMLDLLSNNKEMVQQYKSAYEGKNVKRRALNQAFKTAGDKFDVICDIGAFPIIVECDDTNILIRELENPALKQNEIRRVLRKLQLYTVNITNDMKRKLDDDQAIYPIYDNMLFVLNKRYYSDTTGVALEPVGAMEPLQF